MLTLHYHDTPVLALVIVPTGEIPYGLLFLVVGLNLADLETQIFHPTPGFD